MVRACHAHYPSEVALVCFSSIEEAVQAKAGLDKNPSISGVQVHAEFASEADIKDLCEQFELSIDTAASADPAPPSSSSSSAAASLEGKGQGGGGGGWPRTSVSVSMVPSASSSQAPPLSLSEINSGSSGPSQQWGGVVNRMAAAPPTSIHFGRQASEMSTVSTPGSMWSDGGFLSGFSSPWLSSSPTSLGGVVSSSGGSGGVASTGGPTSMMPSHDQSAGLAIDQTGQPFLPGN